MKHLKKYKIFESKLSDLSALYKCIEYDNYTCIRKYIEDGKSIEYIENDEYDYPPLDVFLMLSETNKKGFLEIVKLMIDSGGLKTEANYLDSIISQIVSDDSNKDVIYKTINLLIENGCKPTTRDLYDTITTGDSYLVDFFIKNFNLKWFEKWDKKESDILLPENTPYFDLLDELDDRTDLDYMVEEIKEKYPDKYSEYLILKKQKEFNL